MTEENQRKCPYGGIWGWRPADYFREPSHAHVLEEFFDCGTRGGLCDRCQQDRADARAGFNTGIIEALIRGESRVARSEDRLKALEAAPELRLAALVEMLPGQVISLQDRLGAVARDIERVSDLERRFLRLESLLARQGEGLEAHSTRVEALAHGVGVLDSLLATHKHPGPMTMAGPGLADKE